MEFNVRAMGYFDTAFTAKQYLFSSQYIATQSNGRFKPNPHVDSLYRYFVRKHRRAIPYSPTTAAPDSLYKTVLALLTR
jgi:hypothetical protein